ncbi:Variable outer membrane protein (plasmid) [Borrelia crocidurae DOU]|uniref:Variable outer membrane protein n=1 Tax=Borrelia crocidurae DOU TaxID=1293575 RepID=W5SLY1_9SPIR|nr:variable large family protein [Borrelia crocidurae]AHH07892.1 Variable outer membrane protein [Borrelia crocidurae DOU]
MLSFWLAFKEEEKVANLVNGEVVIVVNKMLSTFTIAVRNRQE